MKFEVHDPDVHSEDEWSDPVEARDYGAAALQYLRDNDITEDGMDDARRVVMTLTVRSAEDPEDERKIKIGIDREGTDEEFVLGFVVRNSR